MARYIDADALMEKIRKCEFELTGRGIVYPAGDVQSAIYWQPAADVAPRAEVEKLQEVNADLNESLRLAAEANKDLRAVVDRLRFNLKAVLDERAEDKAEVAREIFEEIEREITDALKSNYKVLPQVEESEALWNNVNGKINALGGIRYFIEELEKKYTEEQ